MSESDKITYFAQTNFRNKKVKFGIKVDDRRRHIYIIGKTGMGKSQLLENMIMSDVYHGFGVAVIDPHGDLVENVVRAIPRNRVDDVVYFNPADTEYPIAFNILEKVEAKHRPLVADGVVGVFKKIWADSWGPRLEYILRNAILALLEDEDSTLLGVTRILTDRKYREKVVLNTTDPVVRYFWSKEFPKYPEKDIATIISPIQNKVGQYLSNAMIRNIVGQPKSTINIRDIMDQKKILLLNLSKGRIGEDTSNLLGALMITKLQLAAMSRVDIAEKERKDFYLYVDELQNFATDSFAGILSEARKYHLNMTMAHQYIDQLPEKLQSAVFGNVGTIISFRVGASDAEVLAKEFAPVFTEEDFVNLPKYHIYLKLMIDGVASQPFSAETLPPIAKATGLEKEVIEQSRRKYSQPLEMVEKMIQEWWDFEQGPKKEEKKTEINDEEEQGLSDAVKQQLAKINKNLVNELEGKDKNKEIEESNKEKKEVSATEEDKPFDYSTVDWHNITLHNKDYTFDNVYQCDVCGKEIHLDFQPDLSKPILCRKCLKKRHKAFKREKKEREEFLKAQAEAKEKAVKNKNDQKGKKDENKNILANNDDNLKKKKENRKDQEKKKKNQIKAEKNPKERSILKKQEEAKIKIVQDNDIDDEFKAMLDIIKNKENKNKNEKEKQNNNVQNNNPNIKNEEGSNENINFDDNKLSKNEEIKLDDKENKIVNNSQQNKIHLSKSLKPNEEVHFDD